VNNRRKLIIALGASAFAAPFGTFAQQQRKVWRIGLLSSESLDPLRLDTFRAGLSDLGDIGRENVVIESRWADGKYARLPDLAAELVRLNPDVLVTVGIKATVAARDSNATVPIVFLGVSDPVATGLVSNLSRPGGNVTGLSFMGPELMAKQLELLKEAVPHLTRVAVLQNPANLSSAESNRHAMEIAAKSLKLSLQPFEVRSRNEFDSAFAAMVKRRITAVIVQTDTLFISNSKVVADLATKQRLPSAGFREYAEAGGVIGYGANLIEMFRRAAELTNKILKGAKPGDIPVERAMKFDLVLNMKTAKALALTIPQTILARADSVIE